MPLRPPGSAGGFGSTFIAVLCYVSFFATAQQRQPPVRVPGAYHGPPHEDSLLDTIAPGIGTNVAKRLQTTKDNGEDASTVFINERAIATLAPAADHPAVRAPPARPAAPSAGLSTRHQARSLQDWEVADFVLLATVDGKIYARDRNTGEHRWALESDSPMIETVYHRSNRSSDGDEYQDDDIFWLVEPSQDGNLYIYSPGASLGVQGLGLTVKQLVEDLSPYASEDPPVVYTGEKKNTLYTIDAATGRILKVFSSSGSTVIDEGSCRRMSGLEGLDEAECESVGTLTLGRTEYTIGIQNQATGEPLCTIRYFEWGPNNRDKDLQGQYMSTMDNKYVYSKFDGTIFVLDHTEPRDGHSERPVYRQKFTSPVVRVYDVARPFDADVRDPSLIILPQPVSPVDGNYNDFQNIFVNFTDTGGWYAMSEDIYPTVTEGASKASCYHDGRNVDKLKWSLADPLLRQQLVGVHPLAARGRRQSIPTIAGSEDRATMLEAGSPAKNSTTPSLSMTMENAGSVFSQLATESAKVIVIMILVCGIALRGLMTHSSNRNPYRAFHKFASSLAAVSNFHLQNSTGSRVILNEPDNQHDRSADSEGDALKVTYDGNCEPAAAVDDLDQQSQLPNSVSEGQSPDNLAEDAQVLVEGARPKKKAHRGQRGGRKRKKTSPQNGESKVDEEDPMSRIIEGVKQIGRTDLFQPDQITADESIITDVSGEITLNNLKIHTDKILGAGSGGTFVFEGKFEGRLVAVKRMLPQYFELASQEVSLLQQSDDHPNVIRYFCQQRDSNFLYIAVELCRASLWDLYQGEEPLSEERLALVNEINCEIPRALHQLAAGLSHLHNLRIIHRDIKPQNILVAYPKKNQCSGPRFVISDFGLCKTLPDNASTLIGTTGNAGTVGWKAPELISTPANVEARGNSNHSRDSSSSSSDAGSGQGVKRAVDIFSLGCVFFYVLTGGAHPFDDSEGWVQLRELNIKKGRPNLSALSCLGDDSEEPIHLLTRMLAHKPEARPSAAHVLQHPFFWPADKRLAFLCDVSDHWEREPRDPPSAALSALESFALQVTGSSANFLTQLDRKFVDSLGRQRKYVGSRLLDLLRALRNKRNHYEDLPPDVQARVGTLPDGYLRYWTSRFPKLLMACYSAVEACGLQNEPRFRPYFIESMG